jgi:hypothetical protein
MHESPGNCWRIRWDPRSTLWEPLVQVNADVEHGECIPQRVIV